MVRILGIDPGSRVTGYAIVSVRPGARLSLGYEECGVLCAPVGAPLEQRLAAIARDLGEVIGEFSPDVAAVEDVFHKVNARTALALGQARGAVLAAVGMAGLAVFAYAPAVVKETVTGRGRASKEQVAQMVSKLLGLSRSPRADAADALAVAITHAHRDATSARWSA